jgi:hypothetical protein
MELSKERNPSEFGGVDIIGRVGGFSILFTVVSEPVRINLDAKLIQIIISPNV